MITDKVVVLPRFVADSLGSDSISLFLLNLALMYVYIHLSAPDMRAANTKAN